MGPLTRFLADASAPVAGGYLNAAPRIPDVLNQPDWVVVGIVLAIAGTFLLANAILFRDPREMLRDAFGLDRQRLGSIRTYIFHRVQVTLGFLLMLSGFGLELFGHASQAPDATREFPILWVGVTVGGAALAQLFGWWVSRRLFQRYVRQLLLEGEVDLESDSKLTREVGELFDVEMVQEDTVQSYAARVRARVRLPRGSGGSVLRREAQVPDRLSDEDLELDEVGASGDLADGDVTTGDVTHGDPAHERRA